MSAYQLPKDLSLDFSSPKKKPVGSVLPEAEHRLTSYLRFNERSGLPRDLITRNQCTGEGGAVVWGISVDPYVDLYPSSDRSMYLDTLAPTIGTGDFAYSVTFIHTTTDDIQYAYGADANMMIAARHSGISNSWGVYNGSSLLSATDVLVDGQKYTLLITRIDGELYMYRDGLLQTNQTDTTSITTKRHVFGSFTTGQPQYGRPKIQNTWASSRGFNRSDVLQLHRNPYKLLKPQTPPVYFTPDAVSGNITGTISATNENDTAAITGTLTTSGTITAANEDDTTVISGVTGIVSGTISATNENDTAAITGTLTTSGTITAANEDDATAITGAITVPVTGTISTTNDADTAAITGIAGAVSGSITVTNDSDTGAIAGTITVSGSTSTTTENDTTVISGVITLPVTGTITATSADDTTVISGVITLPITGTIAANNADDTTVISGSVVGDYVTPRHNMSVSSEDRFMSAQTENRIMKVK